MCDQSSSTGYSEAFQSSKTGITKDFQGSVPCHAMPVGRCCSCSPVMLYMWCFKVQEGPLYPNLWERIPPHLTTSPPAHGLQTNWHAATGWTTLERCGKTRDMHGHYDIMVRYHTCHKHQPVNYMAKSFSWTTNLANLATPGHVLGSNGGGAAETRSAPGIDSAP